MPCTATRRRAAAGYGAQATGAELQRARASAAHGRPAPARLAANRPSLPPAQPLQTCRRVRPAKQQLPPVAVAIKEFFVRLHPLSKLHLLCQHETRCPSRTGIVKICKKNASSPHEAGLRRYA